MAIKQKQNQLVNLLSLRVPSPLPSCWKAYPDRRDRELNAKVSARAQLGLEGRAKSLYTRAQGRQGRARPSYISYFDLGHVSNRGATHFELVLPHSSYYKYTWATLSKLTSCAPARAGWDSRWRGLAVATV